MSNGNLTFEEKRHLKLIIEDLKLIFSDNLLPFEKIEELTDKLKTKEVKNYLKFLKEGSKKEIALRDAFFAGNSVLSKYLFSEIIPEERTNGGFIDYSVKYSDGRVILLELKSLFEKDKDGLKQTSLIWGDHKKQIVKYFLEDSQFIILTNLKEWYLFSHKYCTSENHCEVLKKIDLFKFLEEFEVGEDLWQYLERESSYYIREDLDKKFFADLKKWVNLLDEIGFNVDDKKKKELIIYLINKFIFIQTLDDYWAIRFNWIIKTWNELEAKWGAKGKKQILKKFFEDIDDFFYEYYDTELFKTPVWKHIEDNEENIEKLYRNLRFVLGLENWMRHFGEARGILQYNFRQIDEDILGKAYETYLAEIRKEQGIYYTPNYVTEYIVKNTVGMMFDNFLKEIEECLGKEDFDKLNELSHKFISVKVLDPACGSGSFLIKAIKLIWEKYKHFEYILNNGNIKNKNTNSHSFSKYEEDQRMIKIKKLIGFGDNRSLISRLIVRHIHGNDLDIKALDVAKVNIWLQAIKLSPKDFNYENLKGTNHILPNLEINFGNGDSLVGLPEELTVKFLYENHKDDIKKLSELRSHYHEHTADLDLVEELVKIKEEIRIELHKEFMKYLDENDLPKSIAQETIPFHWALEFWYVYFDENGEILDKNEQGFDDVIGNPPYFNVFTMTQNKQLYFRDHPFWGNYYTQTADIFYYFVIRSIELIKPKSRISFIVKRYLLDAEDGSKVRSYLLNNKLEEIIDFRNIVIFEDAGVHTLVFRLTKGKFENNKFKFIVCYNPPNNDNSELIQLISRKSSAMDYLDDFIEFSEIHQSSLDSDHWIYLSKNTSEVFSKIEKVGSSLQKMCRTGTGVQTGRDSVFVEKEPGDFSKKNLEIKGLRKWIKNSDIHPYLIDWKGYHVIYAPPRINIEDFPKIKKYLMDNKRLLETRYEYEKNKVELWEWATVREVDKFDIEKIVTPFKSDKCQFAYDNSKFYASKDVYIITKLPDTKEDIKYLLGILNSKITNFYFNIYGKKLGILKDFYANALLKIPIKPINFSSPKEKEEYSKILKFVELMNMLKKVFKIKNSLFIVWSTKLKRLDYPLSQILKSDLDKIRSGNTNGKWTINSSIYPEDKNKLIEEEFENFLIRTDNKKLMIELYGLFQDSKDKKLLVMEFENSDLYEIVYISLSNFMNSRSKAKTLKDIFDKTAIPVILPANYANMSSQQMQTRLQHDSKFMEHIINLTPNMLKKVREEVQKWLKEEKIYYKGELVLSFIEHQIEDTDARIDAEVFRLYGLNEEEVKTVMDALKVNRFYQDKVFEYFES